eukprot:m.98982 g.98982  ORF g.98982 m.98982 type:complete len:81 (-) comp16766_c0_seq1:3637-3879(-)
MCIDDGCILGHHTECSEENRRMTSGVRRCTVSTVDNACASRRRRSASETVARSESKKTAVSAAGCVRAMACNAVIGTTVT